MRRFLYLSALLVFLSCKKQYSGYCIGEKNANYTVLKFSEEALTKKAAERQVERKLDDSFAESGPWSCEVYD